MPDRFPVSGKTEALDVQVWLAVDREESTLSQDATLRPGDGVTLAFEVLGHEISVVLEALDTV
jgi:hypothetical protein